MSGTIVQQCRMTSDSEVLWPHIQAVCRKGVHGWLSLKWWLAGIGLSLLFSAAVPACCGPPHPKRIRLAVRETVGTFTCPASMYCSALPCFQRGASIRNHPLRLLSCIVHISVFISDIVLPPKKKIFYFFCQFVFVTRNSICSYGACVTDATSESSHS